MPEEMIEYFEVVGVDKPPETLDVTLEERDNGVAGYAPVSYAPTASMKQASYETIR